MSSLSDFASKAEDPREVDPLHLASPSYYSRRVNTRRKGVGGRKKKQMQALERKYQAKSQELLGSLKPIPFAPNKILDFSKQENIFKRLGLWDFAHMQFDRDIRADLIAQLIVSYDSKSRCGYVNGKRINANRADLARSLKLPVKKEKGASMAPASEPVDLDSELPGDETLAFFDDFISNWILLHDDTWIMPLEVLNWTKLIKEGHLEKFDWAGMIWFMVEKELLEGVKLEQCYYSSHLQHLIKSQKEELFFSESEDGDEEDVEVKEEEVKDEREEIKEEGEEIKEEVEEEIEEEEVDEGKKDKDEQEQANILMEGPNVELTLGQDNVQREESKDDEKEEKENKDDEMEEKENKDDGMEENVQGRWISDGKNDMSEHFLQRCNMEVDRDIDSIVWKEEDYEEEEEEEHYEEVKEDFEKEGIEADDDDDDEYDERFSVPSSDDDPLENHENLLQGLDTEQLPFVSALGQLDDHSNMELLEPPPSSSRTHPLSMGPNSVFGNNRKREIGHELDISNDGSNKRLRNDDNSHWVGGHPQHQLHQHTSGDLGMCLDQLQHLIGKAKIMYEEKEQASEQQSNVNEQYLMNELQNRDQIIEHLQRTKAEEIQKKESEIYRMEREMCIMSNLLEGYRKALKETQKLFAQYRKHNQLQEEQIYRDAGPGGLVLSTMEIEKIRLREEEENRVKRTMLEHQLNEITQVAISGLELHFNQLQTLDNRLVGIENAVKLLKDFSAKNKERGMEKEEEKGHEMEIEHGQGDDEEEKEKEKEKEQVDDEEDKKKELGNDEEEDKKKEHGNDEEEDKKKKEHKDEEEQKKNDEDEV